MSMKTKQNRSSYHGGRHARKKTRKNIVVGPKSYVDKTEDTFYTQRQQAAVYMMMHHPQQRRKSSKKPPPKPRRLYLEKEWSNSPSPPTSPDISDFELVPSSTKKKSPPRPPPPKIKNLPSPGLRNNRKIMVPLNSKEDVPARNSVSQDKRQPPLPKPRNVKQQDFGNDVSIDELKSKLQVLQPPATCSTGSAMLKLTPAKPAAKKSSSVSQATQAKVQPLLPPTARPRKTKTESSSLSEDQAMLSIGVAGDRNKLLQAGGARNEMVKSCDDILSRKSKPLPKLPLPVPRSRLRSNKDEEDSIDAASAQTARSRPIPVPKSRNFSESRDQRVSPGKQEEAESNKAPGRPVPRARVISKESREQALADMNRDSRPTDRQLKASERDLNANAAKPPVPRKRVPTKENFTDTPSKDIPPLPCGHDIPMFSASPASKRGSVRFSGDRSGRSKRKKGGGIRMPLWKAPPPPDFTPPSTPRSSIYGSSPKKPPPIADVAVTPTSAKSNFILPPFQHSPMIPPTDEGSSSVFVMPNSSTDGTSPEKPIELAKTPVSPPRFSSEVEFEENLFENKSVKRKRRILSGPNALPLSIVQELQSNFRMQARR